MKVKAAPKLPSEALHRRAHRYGLWLLESIANDHRVNEAVKEYKGALQEFRIAALSEIRELQAKK